MFGGRIWMAAVTPVLMWIGGFGLHTLGSETTTDQPQRSETAAPRFTQASLEAFVSSYCLDCHNQTESSGGLVLEGVAFGRVAQEAALWEKVVRRLAARQMPPAEMPRPDEGEYSEVVAWLEATLDAAYARHRAPGRTETFRRLNRTEYRNAIRDLLELDVDVSTLLPADEASHGFDNVTVADLSPTLLHRYIMAAEKISRLAVGSPLRTPGGETMRLPPDLTQEGHVEGLPLGTRGGGLFSYHFPRDGEYRIEVRLARDRNELVEGLHEPHEMVVLIDRETVATFPVAPARRGEGDANVDAHLAVQLEVPAGTRGVGITFRKHPTSLLETKRQPLNARFNFHRHPRSSPAVYQVSITGPYQDRGPGDTPSRRRVFSCQAASSEEEEACAERIVSRLMRRAYRRPLRSEDLERPMGFYRTARQEGGGFEAGIEMALSAILVNPNFLFRIELDPEGLPPGAEYAITDLELASRLSFFLWSSIPDEELLELAEQGRLREPGVLGRQVERMLADERAKSLVSNFAGQWLYLRNLDSITPDARLFPDFDDNLRQSFRRETELLVERVVREDRSVLDLLRTDTTYLNERLAKHYDIPHIFGSRFREVPLAADSMRGGLLRHGSVLTVTSYATRTSPVIRGQWVLKNLLGVPPPPPPPDVPDLEDNSVSALLPVRERLAVHRANPTCASCHDLMDPVGLSLENFDAVGRWRDFEFGEPVDASGGLPDGSQFVGVTGLEHGLLERPELFLRTLAEKLFTFALGRGVEPADAPAIRRAVRESRDEGYRFSVLVRALVESPPFLMRTTR
jgi:hypothetical protein